MFNKFVLILVSLVSIGAFAVPRPNQSYRQMKKFEGFVQIQPERELWVEFERAEAGKATVVLLHGLTYGSRQWDSYVAEIRKLGLGVVRIDMMGMGQTLLKYAPALAPFPYKQQVEDVKDVLEAIELPKPYNLVGLSYGGGIGMSFASSYPKLVNHLVLIAPFVKPLVNQDIWIRAQIWYTRQVVPWNPASDDELYDYYLRQIVYTTYPSAEPIVLENPYKLEAIFRLVQGIRKFNAETVVQSFPRKRTHLVLAVHDQYVTNDVHDDFWEKVPMSAKASRIYIDETEHKITEAIPVYSAAWINEIVSDNELLTKGYDFYGIPSEGTATSSDKRFQIQLPKE